MLINKKFRTNTFKQHEIQRYQYYAKTLNTLIHPLLLNFSAESPNPFTLQWTTNLFSKRRDP